MDLEKTVTQALEDGTEYYITEGDFVLGGDRVVAIAPKPEHQTTGGLVTDTIRNLLQSSDTTFIVRIYEGDEVQEEGEVENVSETEEWLSSHI